MFARCWATREKWRRAEGGYWQALARLGAAWRLREPPQSSALTV